MSDCDKHVCNKAPEAKVNILVELTCQLQAHGIAASRPYICGVQFVAPQGLLKPSDVMCLVLALRCKDTSINSVRVTSSLRVSFIVYTGLVEHI